MSRSQLMVLSFVAAAALGVGVSFYVRSLNRAGIDSAGIDGGLAMRGSRPTEKGPTSDVSRPRRRCRHDFNVLTTVFPEEDAARFGVATAHLRERGERLQHRVIEADQRTFVW